jgi:hypothetical protein
LLNYEKKPIKLAFADYEAENFSLAENPPFCKTLVSRSYFISVNSISARVFPFLSFQFRLPLIEYPTITAAAAEGLLKS